VALAQVLAGSRMVLGEGGERAADDDVDCDREGEGNRREASGRWVVWCN